MPSRTSIFVVLLVGLITVNLPVLAIMCAIGGIEGWCLDRFALTDGWALWQVFVLGGLLIVIAIAPAWLYWSVMVPRWKKWAYARVNDIQALKGWAVALGLIWRDGHLLERTELTSEPLRQQIRDLEKRGE